MRSTVTGPGLPLSTCLRRLVPFGVRPVDPPDGDGVVLAWPDEGGPGVSVACDISWWGPSRPRGTPGSEALVQAASGLMHLHGRDLGGPRPIGIEIASVAAGMLAAQALLAVAVGRRRGIDVRGVRTSVLQAGLLAGAHHLAAATCPPEAQPAPGPAPGPPFGTSDGRWFEIETFDTEAWKGFWLRLGAPSADLGRAWTLFRPRYYRGTSSLPAGFHEATRAHTLAEATAAAHGCGVSLSPVRGYDEVLADPAEGQPVVTDLGAGLIPGAVLPRRPATSALPLAGIEVVEATSRLQGPLAGLLLQMLGAHVTRVEAPGGDVGRGVPPLAAGTGSFFLCFNRGKDTVELDLTSAGGRADLVDRAASADVFLHNWRPGKGVEWGLTADDLARVNPRLVHAEATGWSPRSGAEGLLGTDFLVQAWTGLGNSLHPEPAPPAPSRVLLTDFMGALVTCEGALAGLHRREQQGGGVRVATSLEAGAMALQAHVLDGLRDDEHGRHRGRPAWGPLDLPVETADGPLAVAAPDADDLGRLALLCGVDPDRPRPELEQAVAASLAEDRAGGWAVRLAGSGVGCEPVVTDLAALPDDPRATPLFEVLAGTCRAPASPWVLEP